MDYNLKTRLYSNATEVLNTAVQQPVDLDFTLADYCADVEKILKYSITPKIYSRTFSAGELRVDGACVVRILYCDQNKKALRCCEQTVPFSTAIPVNAEVSDNIILVSAKQEYINCRALTPRRLTVHGAFTIYATIISKSVDSITEDAEEDILQILRKDERLCELCEFSQEQFTASESVPLSVKNPVESIIRSEMSAVVTDYSKSSGKLNVKGEITLRMLYICNAQAGECDRFVYVFPFAQSIESKDNDWDISDLQVDILNYDLLLKSEMLSEEPTLTIDAKLCVSLMGYKESTISYITDAYSTEDSIELSYEHLNLCQCVHPVSVSASHKTSLHLGDRKVCRILDIYNDQPKIKAEVNDKTLHFFGKINLSILGFTEDGELVCVDRQIDIDLSEPLDKDYTFAKYLTCTVTSLSFRMSDNNELEIRLDLRLSAVTGKDKVICQVTSAVSSDNIVNATDRNSLVLYYASKGEKVWDIAKRYSASISTICEENDLSEEELSESRMVMIVRS